MHRGQRGSRWLRRRRVVEADHGDVLGNPPAPARSALAPSAIRSLAANTRRGRGAARADACRSADPLASLKSPGSTRRVLGRPGRRRPAPSPVAGEPVPADAMSCGPAIVATAGARVRRCASTACGRRRGCRRRRSRHPRSRATAGHRARPAARARSSPGAGRRRAATGAARRRRAAGQVALEPVDSSARSATSAARAAARRRVDARADAADDAGEERLAEDPSSDSEMTRATVSVRRVTARGRPGWARSRARLDRVQRPPARVVLETCGEPLITRETVPRPTPARAGDLLSVGWLASRRSWPQYRRLRMRAPDEVGVPAAARP